MNRPSPTARIASSRGQRRGHARGFTLVELMAAMGASLLVALATMTLARNATRFFQSEARISAAQLATSMGMNRLTADIQRAAFLGPKNNATSTAVGGDLENTCSAGGVVLPGSITGLKGLSLVRGGSVALHGLELVQSTGWNSLNPDSALISGSFLSTEVFSVTGILGAGTSQALTMPVNNDEAMGRVAALATANGTTFDAQLATILKVGSIVRVAVYPAGTYAYGLIQSLSATTGMAPNATVTLTLQASPALPNKNTNKICGYDGIGRTTLSVISQVAYDIRSVVAMSSNATVTGLYGKLVQPDDATTDLVTGSSGRTELVRVMQNPDGSQDPTTLEIVAEFAVDLKFAVTKSLWGAGVNGAKNPTMQSYDFTETTQIGTTPELVRGVGVELSTRARAIDRDSVPLLSQTVRPRFFAMYPVSFTPGATPVGYARMRTLYAYVNLPSQQDY